MTKLTEEPATSQANVTTYTKPLSCKKKKVKDAITFNDIIVISRAKFKEAMENDQLMISIITENECILPAIVSDGITFYLIDEE